MTRVRRFTWPGDGWHEDGWIGLTTMMWTVCLFLVLFLVIVATTDVLATRARAQTAADAAALAAVTASPLVGGDGDPAGQAGRLAVKNDARLDACDCGDLMAAEVTVSATPQMRWVRVALPRVRARARAELQPEEPN